ncbi:Xaa-Pro peptidase family protein [Sodalis sp. dw_96]|uniref:M24 family metallopeptidase n=1 Tax=Sodalis sp. dw_96 TaxID=2719794 RepID=UPI001BD475AD|nr:Xaa-Pro peptidase family protein [Sodalis sp. dw_96]
MIDKNLIDSIPQGSDSAFPQQEFDSRIAKLQAILKDNNIDLYLTSGAENIFYLSGQQTPGYYVFQCLAIPVQGTPFLVLRELESYNARFNTYLNHLYGYGDGFSPAEALASAIEQEGWKGKRIAIDRNAWFLTVNIFAELSARLGEMQDGSGYAESLRRVKSPLEILALEEAARENDAGMAAGIQAAKAGVDENAIAGAIMGATITAGSEYMGMEPFVTSGPRSGVPHTTWRRRVIQQGDVVVLETAGCHHRYHAALFRTIMVGDVPQKARDWYDITRTALAAAMAAMKPGNLCSDVHDAAQRVIDAGGATDAYRKRTGYSMGISFAPDWGEGNILHLNKGYDVELVEGMAFHIPITLREYAQFTVACSETVIVTRSGCRSLSKISQDLINI